MSYDEESWLNYEWASKEEIESSMVKDGQKHILVEYRKIFDEVTSKYGLLMHDIYHYSKSFRNECYYHILHELVYHYNSDRYKQGHFRSDVVEEVKRWVHVYWSNTQYGFGCYMLEVITDRINDLKPNITHSRLDEKYDSSRRADGTQCPYGILPQKGVLVWRGKGNKR